MNNKGNIHSLTITDSIWIMKSINKLGIEELGKTEQDDTDKKSTKLYIITKNLDNHLNYLPIFQVAQ